MVAEGRWQICKQVRQICTVAAMAAVFALSSAGRAVDATPTAVSSILVYHRFADSVKDSMTVRVATFRWQLQYLKAHGYEVIRLERLIDYLRGRSDPPPPRSIVITTDDGHASVFSDMLPVIREYGVPVTLFIYPSAISNASYAMTWPELEALGQTRLFEIQSHTYWHPNFTIEKRRRTPESYRTFAMMQLVKSRTVLKDRLGVNATYLAWPFGICDPELLEMARDVGYIAGFTLERRPVTSRDNILALPRFLVTDRATGAAFAAMLPGQGHE